MDWESSESSQVLPMCMGSKVSVPKLSWFESMTQIVGLTAAWHQGKVEGNLVGVNAAGTPKENTNPVHAEFNFFL